jgi:hypothetical protein
MSTKTVSETTKTPAAAKTARASKQTDALAAPLPAAVAAPLPAAVAAPLPAAVAAPLPAAVAAPREKLVLVRPEYTALDVITSVAPNLKRPGTTAYNNYAKYLVGMTVLDYLANSDIPRAQASTCVRFDLARRYITVGKKQG